LRGRIAEPFFIAFIFGTNQFAIFKPKVDLLGANVADCLTYREQRAVWSSPTLSQTCGHAARIAAERNQADRSVTPDAVH
jgi:hypothetical protein